MSNELCGNGFTTTDAATGERISANYKMYAPWPRPEDGSGLNATGATQVEDDNGEADKGFAFQNVGRGPGRIVLTKQGYRKREIDVVFPIDTNINYTMERSTPPVPPAAEPLTLHRDGLDFKRPDGTIEKIRGFTAHTALQMYVEGSFGELSTYLQQVRDYGGNTVLVFTCYDATSAGRRRFTPLEHYSKDDMRLFVTWVRRTYGIRVWFVAFCDQTDTSSIRMADWQQDDHWRNCVEANADFLTVMNEPYKNGGYTMSARFPYLIGRAMITRGAVQDGEDPRLAGPLMDFTTAHSPRGAQQERKYKVTLEDARLGGGDNPDTPVDEAYDATGRPAVNGEPPQLATMTPRNAADYFTGAEQYGAGAVVHDAWETMQQCKMPTDGTRLDAISAIVHVWLANIIDATDFSQGTYVRDGLNVGCETDDAATIKLYGMERNGHLQTVVIVGGDPLKVKAKSGWMITSRLGHPYANVIDLTRTGV